MVKTVFLRSVLPLMMWFCATRAVAQLHPVGLVLSSRGGHIRRAGTSYSLTAKTGDVLAPGDFIETAESETVRVAFCPTKESFQISPSSSLTFSPNGPPVHGDQS